MHIHYDQFRTETAEPAAGLPVAQDRPLMLTVGLGQDDPAMICAAASQSWTLAGCFGDLRAFEPAMVVAGVQGRTVVLVDWAMLRRGSWRIDRVLAIRTERPDLCVILCRHDSATDMGHERLALCDATLGGAVVQADMEALVGVALRNNRIWQQRCRDRLREAWGMPRSLRQGAEATERFAGAAE